MQVRSFTQFTLVAGIAVAAAVVGIAGSAHAQELDPSETLQARSLAAQAAQHERDHQRSRAAVAAEVRNLQASGQVKTTGEKAEAPAVEQGLQSRAPTRAEVKADLVEYLKTRKPSTGETDEGPVVDPAPEGRALTRAEVKADLVEYLKTRKPSMSEADEGPAVEKASNGPGLTRAEIKSQLIEWRKTHTDVAGELY